MKLQIDNLGKVAITIEEDYWDIKKPYDKLTIVERAGTGTTFISRKPVPTGTSILNRNYWIKFSKWSDIPYEITQKFGDSNELAISQKTLTDKFSEVETEIQEGDEALDQRLRVVEVHERIMVDGGELEVATAEDLENPQTPRQEAAVPTVRAILDASDDEPHLNSTKRFINSDNLAKMYGYYLDNPEFIYLLTDDEYHIILGIKTDGDVVFGVTVPSQIKEYIDSRINEIFGVGDITEKIDTIKEMIAFFDEISHDTTLKELLAASAQAIAEEKTRAEAVEQHLDEVKANKEEVNAALYTKVDKEEGKSLINEEYASSQSAIENPEYLQITTDSKDKILEGIQKDGTKVIGGDLKVLGNIEVFGVSYNIIENIEYLAAWVDAENKIIFGLKTDGKTYIGDADFLNNIKDNQEAITKIKTTLAAICAEIDSLDIYALSSTTVTENPEFTEVTTDSEGNILSGRTPDGAAFENIGLSTPKVSIDGCIVENIEDPEERKEITIDLENKIISYRDSNGVKHEEVGIDARKAIVKSLIAQNITFKNDDDNNAFAKSLIYRSDSLKKYDLPDNGSINILNETFYLTKHEGYTDKNGIYPIQEYENNFENAEAKRICRVYYVKSTLRDNGDGTYSKIEGSVPLTLYVPKQILVVNDTPYVKDTLTEVSDGVYEVNEDSIAVTKITARPDFQTWAINKNDEHQCKVAIDFGNYLSGEFFIGIKFQGASTLNRPKRNLRFTFYKKSDYNKKLKVKIGEFVRLSGFNLKAFWGDVTKLKEAVLNRIMMAVWEKRPDINKTYPWIKDYGFYTGATGMIKSFPSMVSINGEYYGFYIFGLKKDEKNYMLNGDDDASGIFASCDGINWKNGTARNFSDEMGVNGRELAYPDMGDDSLSVESAKALNVFLSFAANTLCTGSDGLSYGKGDLTFYVGKRNYTYDKVTTTDDSNGFVLIANNNTKITAIYVTESLQTKNLLAQRTEERAYRGTDGNLYILSELTLIDGEYFVTKSLQQDNPIKAVILSGNVYNVDIDGEIFRFTSSELTKIDNIYYHIYHYPNDNSISATYEPFSQSEATKHMDILGFIDYFIGLQVFYMPDNVAHNLILYTKADKKVFYPFFYDMDLTFPNYNEITSNVLDAYDGNTNKYIIWYSLIEEYADVIYNRYVELRNSILNIYYIKEVFDNLRCNIPQRWVDAEHSLWGATFDYNGILSNLMQRFDWLDKYFLNLIK